MSRKRTNARTHAIQAIYQWQMTGEDLGEIVNQFLIENDNQSFDVTLFRELVTGVPKNIDRLDTELGELLDRNIDSVDLVERAILRVGAFEIADHPEVPYRVVINEYVDLGKSFGAEQGYRYINGILDKLAQKLRPHEVAAT
ncbi:MAG: transcription antitermination factor NusB [bacterium]